MGIAFAVLFPLGAIILRLFRFRGIAWFHGIWQTISWVIAIVGLGLGIWLANNGEGELVSFFPSIAAGSVCTND